MIERLEKMMALSTYTRITLLALTIIGVTSCRSQLGGKCTKKDDCALGLYCDLEKEICADRGQLLKKEAEKIYVYPIPSKVKPK